MGLRFCVPTCTIRLCLRAASTILRPSQQFDVGGFSTYTSLPAWQAHTVAGACQWSGVAITTASTPLASSTFRKSCTALEALPGCFLATAVAIASARLRSTSATQAMWQIAAIDEAFPQDVAASSNADAAQDNLVVRQRRPNRLGVGKDRGPAASPSPVCVERSRNSRRLNVFIVCGSRTAEGRKGTDGGTLDTHPLKY